MLNENMCRRVFELQALPILAAHAIRASHPAAVIQQLIGSRWIKHRAGQSSIIAWMHGRGFVGAEWTAEAVERLLDHRLVIDRHRYCLAHFQVAGQHRIVKVEVDRLIAGTGGRSSERSSE